MIPQRHAHQKIGLLGGSFNPPHAGHREISLLALQWLGLDAVWWLVSPGNPLKDPTQNAPYEERLAQARKIASHPAIVVSNFEARRGLQYTVDTLEALVELWPQIEFVWLMGADNLATIDRWRDWRRIFALAPVAVFNRPGYEKAEKESAAAQAFAAFRLDESRAGELAGAEPPAWIFFHDAANPLSSTAIRAHRAAKD
ncbi:MAG: nicotinate-nucleotide adenylyltransferase [Alphaproteobacteria bacterium]|nr:nicotinate-nucleotide adenylyltransferase [Alphaproteobacteria bacterium]